MSDRLAMSGGTGEHEATLVIIDLSIGKVGNRPSGILR